MQTNWPAGSTFEFFDYTFRVSKEMIDAGSHGFLFIE
jgi:hypothetical protein